MSRTESEPALHSGGQIPRKKQTHLIGASGNKIHRAAAHQCTSSPVLPSTQPLRYLFVNPAYSLCVADFLVPETGGLCRPSAQEGDVRSIVLWPSNNIETHESILDEFYWITEHVLSCIESRLRSWFIAQPWDPRGDVFHCIGPFCQLPSAHIVTKTYKMVVHLLEYSQVELRPQAQPSSGLQQVGGRRNFSPRTHTPVTSTALLDT